MISKEKILAVLLLAIVLLFAGCSSQENDVEMPSDQHVALYTSTVAGFAGGEYVRCGDDEAPRHCTSEQDGFIVLPFGVAYVLSDEEFLEVGKTLVREGMYVPWGQMHRKRYEEKKKMMFRMLELYEERLTGYDI